MKANDKTLEEIYQIVQVWKDSGLTKQSFCQQEQLILIYFFRWVKKGREHENVVPVSGMTLQIKGCCSLVSSGIEMEYPNGVRLRLNAMPSGSGIESYHTY